MILLLAQRGIQYLYSELPDTVEVNYIEAMTSTSYFISGRLYGNYYYQPDPRGGNYSIGFATFQGVFNPAVSLKKVIALSAMLYGEYWRGDFIYNTTVYEANKTYLFGERGPYAYVSRFTIGLPLLKSLLGVVQLGQTWLNWSPFFAYRVWGIPGVQIKGPFYKKWGYQGLLRMGMVRGVQR